MAKNKELSILKKAAAKEDSMAQPNNNTQTYQNGTRPIEGSTIPQGLLRIQSLTNNIAVKEHIHCASADVFPD